MKTRPLYRQLALVALALTAAQTTMAAGFVTLSKTAAVVLTNCSRGNWLANPNCKVEALPGAPNYKLWASRSTPLIYNDIRIGTLAEKVWRSSADPKTYVLGAQVTMNANPYDSTGLSFNVNDVFRQTLPNQNVAVAYYFDAKGKSLKRAGRTVQGLNEFEKAQPERDNTWVDFRIDTNAADPDGNSSRKSPWLLTKTAAPKGLETNALGFRVLNSDVADPLDALDFFTRSYQPVGVPPPEDEDDDEDAGD